MEFRRAAERVPLEHDPMYVVWVYGILGCAVAVPVPFGAGGEGVVGVVAASLGQLPRIALVRVEQ